MVGRATDRPEAAGSSTVRWHFADGEEAAARDWLGRFWPSILGDKAHVVKEDANRRVAVGGGYVVKEYGRRGGPLGWLDAWVGARARKAFDMGRCLARAGVPVPAPVAWGAVGGAVAAEREYLITRELPRARRLAEWMTGPETSAEARDHALDKLGELLGGFHRAGFVNRDLKSGHVLLTESAGGAALWAVDLDGVRRARFIGRRHIRRDFFPMVLSLASCGWDTEDARRRLLAAYNRCTGRRAGLGVMPDTARGPWKRARGWVCVRRAIRPSGWLRPTLHIYMPAGRPEWERLGLSYWQGDLPGLEKVRSSRYADVRILRAGGTAERCYFKRFLMRSAADRLAHVVRRSRAVRAFDGASLAMARGFSVPRSVCVIEARRCGFPVASAFVTEAVEEAVSLHALLAGADGAKPLPARERRAVAAQLGVEVGRWHAAGLVHGDLRLGNIMCRNDGQRIRFIFLDNERTRLSGRRHERARNLVQLNMTDSALLSVRDRVCFWRAYSRTSPGTRQWKRALRAETVAWTRRRWRELGRL